MYPYLSIGLKSFLEMIRRKILQLYQRAIALKLQFGYMLLIVCSAFMGLVLQYQLPKIDPLAAVVDSSIWVVTCYTLCSFLIYHWVSLKLTQILLRMSQAYSNNTLNGDSWKGKISFLSVYFLLLYGFLLCLLLWM